MQLNYENEKRFGFKPELNDNISSIPDDSVLTPDDIGQLIGISPRTARRYCEQGRIPSYCFNRKYIVYGNDFKNFMKKCFVRPGVAKDLIQ